MLITAGGDESTQAVLVDGGATGAAASTTVASAPVLSMSQELATVVLAAVNVHKLQARCMEVLWRASQSATKEDGVCVTCAAGARLMFLVVFLFTPRLHCTG